MEIITPSCMSVELRGYRILVHGPPREVGEIRLVCKGWRDNCDEHIVKLMLSPPQGPTTVSAMRTFLRRFPSVQAVMLSDDSRRAPGHMWANVVESLVPTNLTGLCYTGGGSHNGDYIQRLTGFKALTTLHLRGHFSSVRGLEFLTSLKTLCLRGTSDVLDDDAFSSLSRLINLTDLDLTYCNKLSSPHGFAPLACFTALTSLNLDITLANDDVLLRTVSTLSALTSLAIKLERPERSLISLVAVRRLQNILPNLHVFMQRCRPTARSWLLM